MASSARTATMSSPSSPTSISTLLRYVPQGEASLYEDAPGWSGTAGMKTSLTNFNNLVGPRFTPHDSPTTAAATTTTTTTTATGSSSMTTWHKATTGPLCWKCQGAGNLPRRSKKFQKKRRHMAATQKDGGGTNNNNTDATSHVSSRGTKKDDDACHANETNETDVDTTTPTTLEKQRECSVCHGTGHLPPKMADVMGWTKPGVITSGRRHVPSWKPSGPLPHAFLILAPQSLVLPKRKDVKGDKKDDTTTTTTTTTTESYYCHWAELVHRANQGQAVEIPNNQHATSSSSSRLLPTWLPQPGEELCNLVGSWRILQRVGSHRWTTDDLVTAFCAAQVSKQLLLLPVLCLESNDDGNNNNNNSAPLSSLSYLDLGTGNGSVLQMVTWALLRELESSPQNCRPNLECWGIEARREAVELARRSIAFNIGSSSTTTTITTTSEDCPVESPLPPPLASVEIVHGDFRQVVETKFQSQEDGDTKKNPTTVKLFDLITGTPPYFRVNFTVEAGTNDDSNAKAGETTTSLSTKTTTTTIAATMGDDVPNKKNGHSNSSNNHTNNKNKKVTKAQIRQGGMPTARQSAPARCEFRGGIEAYCHAASQLLHPSHGRFVVCENWSNQARVHKAAEESGLEITSILKVQGKVARETLFAVYTMMMKKKKKQKKLTPMTTTVVNGPLVITSLECPAVLAPSQGNSPDEALSTETTSRLHLLESAMLPHSELESIMVQESTIAVRTKDGDWTNEYQSMVLDFMSIPAPPPTAS
jgi:hypothetical protein